MDSSLNVCTNGDLQSLLRCWFCKKFLSVPPIYQHDSGSICGRCNFINVNKQENSQFTRQIVYESIAQYLIFPCSNASSGCTAQLKWGQVEEHENSCPWKEINCPFIHSAFQTEQCFKWMGFASDLNEHLKNCHHDNIQKLPELNFTDIEVGCCVFLTQVKRKLMIIAIQKCEAPGKFSCLVMMNGTSTECKDYCYELEFSDQDKENLVAFGGGTLEEAVAFNQNLKNSDKALVVDIPVIKGLLKSDVVVGRFNIMKKDEEADDHQEKNPQMEQNCVLREFKCYLCEEYMIPPIMTCKLGHSFCNLCKEKMVKCPICKKGFQKGRNETLEKLTSFINYPCTFRQAGCLVLCSSEKIKEHEQNCTFSSTPCFLCSTKRYANIFEHLKEDHQDSLIVAGAVSSLDIGDSEEILQYYAICFRNSIFKLSVCYDGAITFCLRQTEVEQSSYSYEVEILYSADSSQKIIMGRKCPRFRTVSIDPWYKSVFLSEDMVQRFISDDNLLFFKVNLKMIVAG